MHINRSFPAEVLSDTIRPLYRPTKHHIPHLLINMLEHDDMPYFGNTSRVNSTGSYEVHYWPPAEIYPSTISTLPPQDGSLDVGPSWPQSNTPSFAYGSQRLEVPLSYSSHPLQQWASSHSRYGGESANPSFWGYPTTMDVPQTTVPPSRFGLSTLNQPSASDFGMTCRSEPQKGMRLNFASSFHSELERLQQSNTSQTGSKSKPVPGSAEWANKFALQRERVEKLPFQDTPVQHLESGSIASVLPSEPTAPQTALTGSAAAAFGYGGEMMAQIFPFSMMPSSTSTYGPQTVKSSLDGSFPFCHLDSPILETVYSSGTAAQWLVPTNGPPHLTRPCTFGSHGSVSPKRRQSRLQTGRNQKT